jgi:ubiquinone/menaquinone biosynthesis C-methylase UbiE
MTEYFMESEREGDRVLAKTDEALAALQLQWAGLTEGADAVDVGCASGAVTSVIARLAAPGRVIGVDMSSERLEQARGLGILGAEFVQANIDDLPFANGTFDFTWSRFLVEYLPDVPRAIDELIRVTRPGGTVCVSDVDGQVEQIWPVDSELGQGIEDAIRLLAETGFDQRAGRKLYPWFHQSVLDSVRVDVRPYQVYTGALGEADVANWTVKLQTVAAALGERTGDHERWSQLGQRYLTHLQQPGTFYYASLVTVCGIVPIG